MTRNGFLSPSSYGSNYSFGFTNSISDLVSSSVNMSDVDLWNTQTQISFNQLYKLTREESPYDSSNRSLWLLKPRRVRYGTYLKIK